ncbi:glutathione S-transferase family protein [Mesorhizobium sp. L-2-11]|uniref:glutathione S-transferase family protein n=1 Tax=Mesorhizobium sp. L-2-11 TaxID=2744521 RepID=UPI0019271C5F|nr:glutathione S-transferase family protein [Mesorhizobium sp. L-2-11]
METRGDSLQFIRESCASAPEKGEASHVQNRALWQHPMSLCAAREAGPCGKGLSATEIEIDPRNKSADFLAISPTGKVPLLVHNGVRVWEAAVINEYLDEAFPEHPLLPKTPAQRALARIWTSFADSRLYEPTHRLLLCSDPNIQARIAEQLGKEIRFLETHALAAHDGPYWLGDAFSLADIALFPWFEQVAVLECFRLFLMPAECTRIRAWREAVARRGGVRSAARSSDFYVQGYTLLFDRLAQGVSVA